MKIRRVVTGHNEKGQSVIKWDGEINGKRGRTGFSFFPICATKELPIQHIDEDPGTWKIGTTVANGSVFRVVKYEPGVTERWHQTDSIDYAIVLSGEIYMQLDDLYGD